MECWISNSETLAFEKLDCSPSKFGGLTIQLGARYEEST